MHRDIHVGLQEISKINQHDWTVLPSANHIQTGGTDMRCSSSLLFLITSGCVECIIPEWSLVEQPRRRFYVLIQRNFANSSLLHIGRSFAFRYWWWSLWTLSTYCNDWILNTFIRITRSRRRDKGTSLIHKLTNDIAIQAVRDSNWWWAYLDPPAFSINSTLLIITVSSMTLLQFMHLQRVRRDKTAEQERDTLLHLQKHRNQWLLNDNTGKQ